MQVTGATLTGVMFIAVWLCVHSRPAEFRRHRLRHRHRAHSSPQFGRKSEEHRPSFQDWSWSADRKQVLRRHNHRVRHHGRKAPLWAQNLKSIYAKDKKVAKAMFIKSVEKYRAQSPFKYEFVG